MNTKEARFYRERWKAVEQIEREELRASTVQQNWKQLNAIMRRSIRLNLSRGDDNETDVFLRWAKLKIQHEISR